MSNPAEIKGPLEGAGKIRKSVVPHALNPEAATPLEAQEINSSSKESKKLTGKKLLIAESAIAAAVAGAGAGIVHEAKAQTPPSLTPIVQENKQTQTSENIQLVKDPGIAPQTAENLVNKYFPNALEASGLQMPQEFIDLWEAVGDGKIQRGELQGVPWMFGPDKDVPIVYETYNGKQRIVAYFDKGRVEEGGTTGLLANELITGQMQTGDATFEFKGPADIAAVGDKVPGNITYKELSQNQYETVEPGLFEERTANEFKTFFKESGERIPNTPENLWFNAGIELMGHPTGPAMWRKQKVGGVDKDVLVQPFERRVLTYTPSNPEGWQVEMGNIGQDYLNWRYGEGGTGGQETQKVELAYEQGGDGWYVASSKKSKVIIRDTDKAKLDQLGPILRANGIDKKVMILLAGDEAEAIRLAKEKAQIDATGRFYDYRIEWGGGQGENVGKIWGMRTADQPWGIGPMVAYFTDNIKQIDKKNITLSLNFYGISHAIGLENTELYNQLIGYLYSSFIVDFSN